MSVLGDLDAPSSKSGLTVFNKAFRELEPRLKISTSLRLEMLDQMAGSSSLMRLARCAKSVS